MSAKFMIGADPEIFVKRRGKAVAAYGLVEGTKENPQRTSRGAIQVDGMALEFNIDPSPLNDFESFNNNIVATLRDLRTAVNNKAANYNFNISPTQDFDKEYMDSLPMEAKELGCDPDFNAYTLKQNPPPDGTQTFRSAAGHIHIGWGADIPVTNEDHMKICASFVKMLDKTVGMYMTCIDQDQRRRQLYGKAGAFRPKSYGVEYRTPSNMWISTREKRVVLHGLVNFAVHLQSNIGKFKFIKYTFSEGFNDYFWGLTDEEVQRIINTGDFDKAMYIVNNLVKGCPYGTSKHWQKIVASLNNKKG